MVGKMRVKKVFFRDDGKKVMEINVLPGKYCTFNCVCCPIEEKGIQTEASYHFEETEAFLSELAVQIDAEGPEVLFINSMGEAFANDRLGDVIALGKEKGLIVSLYSNGYLLGDPRYAELARRCDEVSGEIRTMDEDSFRKIHRPLEGRSMEEYLNHMGRFRKTYQGRFIIYVTVMRGINDDPESLQKLRRALDRLAPHRVVLETFTDEKFGKVWSIPEERQEEIRTLLQQACVAPGA